MSDESELGVSNSQMLGEILLHLIEMEKKLATKLDIVIEELVVRRATEEMEDPHHGLGRSGMKR